MKAVLCILIKSMVLMLSCATIFATVFTSHALAEGFLFIERPKLGLGVSFEFEEVKRAFNYTETEATQNDMIEKVTVGANGWVYHPNFMIYRLFFEPEWRQEEFQQSHSLLDSTPKRKRKTSMLAYDAETTLFKQKPLSLDIFGNRNTRKIDLSYTQNTDIENETLGTRLTFTHPILPASIGFTNRRFTQTGFYRSDEDRNEVQIKARHNVKKSVTELNMLHNNTESTTWTTWRSVDVSSETTNAELTNTFFFTGNESIKLDSLLYLSESEYDDIRIGSQLASGNLFWTHSRNLLTQIRLNYNRREVDKSKTEEKAARALFTYRLDDTLTANLGAGASFSNFGGGGEDRYHSDLGFIYRRPIPWGSIELGAAYDYGITNRSGNLSIIPNEERHVLSSGVETFLYRENIITESIMVTDIAGAIIYTENIDYRIETLGSTVRISRTLSGAIADGQQVNVHYRYRLDSGFDDSRFGQDYRFSLKLWSFLYFTYSYGNIHQDILSGIPSSVPLNDTHNSVRIRLDFKWSETQLLYDKQDRSHNNSSVTRRLSQLININLMRNLFLNFSGNIEDRDYLDLRKVERFYSLGTNIGWAPKWWCHISLICLWNRISGDQQDMLYTEISPTVKLIYGVWTATFSYRLKDQEDDRIENSLWRQKTYVTIERSLW